jgi:hypothetical protein
LKSERKLWRHIRFAALFSAGLGYVADLVFNHGMPWFLFRMLAVGIATVFVFEVFAKWPAKLWLGVQRWVMQVLAVACAVPLTTLVLWSVTTPLKGWPFWQNGDRLMEFSFVTFIGLLVAPWAALSALVRQKDTFAREQQIIFELTRSELELREQDARLQLMQAQVSPHFLFNTLANIQALVDAGSPRAGHILRALTKYLRSAVPRLTQDDLPNLHQELESVRAYLDLMQMRMPDRLEYSVTADAGTERVSCPPLFLMTLVENAVRHGIDPSETGGRIDVRVRLQGACCIIAVEDTGIGNSGKAHGTGSGLKTLRARLELTYGESAALRLQEITPHGFLAELEIPAECAPT